MKNKNIYNGTGYSGDWKQLLKESITTAEELAAHLDLDEREQENIRRVSAKYPFRINPYYLSLINSPSDALGLQAIPDHRELTDNKGLDDPLCEEETSPVPHLTHRYADRVILLVSDRCSMYCRFCMRKRKVGYESCVSHETVRMGIQYIRDTPEIKDVIITGGDPLMLSDNRLEEILSEIHKIPHVDFIRIHSRIPCTLPQRVTPDLASMIKKYHPVFMNVHFNHPLEITPEAERACKILADAGIPMGNQNVLLRGVNDSPEVLKTLYRKLMKMRVKPYYLHHADLVKGTGHFRCHVKDGVELIRSLRGHVSGMCIPHYVIDLPGGGGKIPLTPDYIKEADGEDFKVINHKNKIYTYPM